MQPIHRRPAKARAQAGAELCASLAILQHLACGDRSNGDRAVVVAALVSYAFLFRVAEMASVCVMDVLDLGVVAFWNSKTRDEGRQRRPVPGWLRPYLAWASQWAADKGMERDDLLFQGVAAYLEMGLRVGCNTGGIVSNEGGQLRVGEGVPCCHFKWWGRWAATATAMPYALG